jgi:hypothetical protein
MERQELLMLIKNALSPEVGAKFSAQDANSAALNALFEAIGCTADASIKELKRNPAAFTIIEEAIDEKLPADLQNVLGQFAEIKTYARDAEVVFKMSNVGKRRAKLSITRGARGGIYRAVRLDAKQMQLDVQPETVGVYVTLEDILLGTYTLGDLYANILEGFEQKVYLETVKALQSAKTLAPTANVAAYTDAASLMAALDEKIQIAKQYGEPIIVGFRKALAQINNVDTISANPSRAYQDLDDIRNKGFVQLYKGTPIQELPNYLVDDKNDKWLIPNEDYIFVLPATTKPVKVAFKGDMTLIDNRQPTGSEKYEAHKLMGVGLMLANDVCVLYSEEEGSGSTEA